MVLRFFGTGGILVGMVLGAEDKRWGIGVS
jgi:hypothetical protein